MNKVKKIFQNRHTALFLIFLLVLATFFRFYNLYSASLWMDEGFSIALVKRILDSGWQVIFLDNFDKTALLHNFFLFLGVKIFGENEFAYRFFPAIFGVLSVLISFFLAKKIFPKQKAVPYLSSLFLVLSQWQIVWSMQARMYSQLQFFFLLALLFLFSFYEKEKLKDFLFFIFFAICAFLSHKLGLFLLIFAFIGFFVFGEFKKHRSYILTILIFGIGLFAVDFLVLDTNLFEFNNYLGFYLRFLIHSHLWIFLLALLAFMMRSVNFDKKEKKVIVFVGACFVVYFLCLSFFVPLLNYRYLFPLFPLMIILAMVYLETGFYKASPRLKFLWIILFVLLSFFSNELVYFPQEKYYLESDSLKYSDDYRVKSPQPDFKKAHQFIKDNLQNEEIIISAYPEITDFYIGKTDYFLPFDLEEQVNWDNTDFKIRHTNSKPITDLVDLHKLVLNQKGFIVFDQYASEKIPQDVLSYIEFNTDLIFEEQESIDSAVFIYRFN